MRGFWRQQMKAINTEALTKSYGKARGIIDLDLSVNEGDFFGFIGPNGAGKSTTIRTLLGLVSPTSGRGEVLGLDITKNRTEILRQVGYLPGEAFFYSGMKVRDALRLSAKLRGVDCAAEAKTLCERLDLDPNRKIDQLSLGNREKVGIVCALQHKPALYVLDEPTSGLDPLMQKEFYDILCERNREGATVFLSSHILSEVDKYCKNASIIREGRQVVSDSIENLSRANGKRVVLRGADPLPENEAIRGVKQENGTVSFLYCGHPKELISLISTLSFEDVSLTDPELDEIFLHYYKKEEN